MQPFIGITPGSVLRIFNTVESREIEKKWMSIYRKNKQGFNTKAFKWHIFSGCGYPSTESDTAQKNYETVHRSHHYSFHPTDQHDLQTVRYHRPRLRSVFSDG